MGAIGRLVIEILLASFLAERLLEGLHKSYWGELVMGRLKKHFPAPETREVALWSLQDVIGEFIHCKFCQSWGMGWASILAIMLSLGDWSWHWIWAGIVTGSISNLIHHLRDGLQNWNRRFLGD